MIWNTPLAVCYNDSKETFRFFNRANAKRRFKKSGSTLASGMGTLVEPRKEKTLGPEELSYWNDSD